MQVYLLSEQFPNNGEWCDDFEFVTSMPVYSYFVGCSVFSVEYIGVLIPQPSRGTFEAKRWRALDPLKAEELARFRIFDGGKHSIATGPCIALHGAEVAMSGDARAIFGTLGASLTCRDRASALLAFDASAEVFDGGCIRATGKSSVKARGKSFIALHDYATAECWDYATISTADRSSVISHASTVRAAIAGGSKIEGEYTRHPLWSCKGSLTC